MADERELLSEALVHLRAINSLLQRLVERLPDPNAPLAEAVEWETSDGVYRTTDRKMAENWANAVGVTVVRRALPASSPASATEEPIAPQSKQGAA